MGRENQPRTISQGSGLRAQFHLQMTCAHTCLPPESVSDGIRPWTCTPYPATLWPAQTLIYMSHFHLCAQSLIASRIGEDSSTPALSSWFDRARAHLAPCSLAACGPTRHSLPQTTLSLGDSNQRRWNVVCRPGCTASARVRRPFAGVVSALLYERRWLRDMA